MFKNLPERLNGKINLKIIGYDGSLPPKIDDRFIDSILYALPNLKINRLDSFDCNPDVLFGPHLTKFVLLRVQEFVHDDFELDQETVSRCKKTNIQVFRSYKYEKLQSFLNI